MKRTVLIVLLFIISFVAITIKPVQATQNEDTVNKITKSINEILKTTIYELGNSRSSVVSKMGKPLFMSSEFVANPNNPLHDNIIFALHYDGIVILIYHETITNNDKIISVKIKKNIKILFSELFGKVMTISLQHLVILQALAKIKSYMTHLTKTIQGWALLSLNSIILQ